MLWIPSSRGRFARELNVKDDGHGLYLYSFPVGYSKKNKHEPVVLAIQLTAIYQCGPTLRYIFESIDRNVNDRQLKQKVASSSPAYEVTSSRVSYSQSAEQHRLCTDGLDGDE